MTIPDIRLSASVTIPQVGFGVFQIPDEETTAAVETAIEAGYRHIDTAAIYRNERGVGQALTSSGIARGDIFVTSKLWPDDFAAADVRPALEKSLSLLGTDYLDLYLLHWPVPGRGAYVGAWEEVLKAREEGLIREAGVSNFTPELLSDLIERTGVTPAINQVKLDPTLQQPALRAYHDEHGIVTEAYSPLAQGEVLGSEPITTIAQAHGVTPAQVVLRWHIQHGTVVIPKSVTPERIASNLDLFGFELSADEVALIDAMDAGDAVWQTPLTFLN
ncbi:aldo/keto reductase [Rarobacter faecitabidus]|uniref:2,5-diketo-D-gluconate reductase A n=1 Tax=Rarobacter faecitabidus TaxID=13243 RepID=A0A542ZWK9_RARFA|nr:aldo/keto reductase [Rarobacter faecitabidus]TQL64745.1 2,5-diketo-D-gluconate reductase A [Rarobacter faecitabidus]